MAALKQAVAAMAVQKGPKCGAAALRNSLPPDVQADFDDLMAGNTYSSVICKALKDLGYPVKLDALQRHRRKGCECQR